jgi:hypothetical protein
MGSRGSDGIKGPQGNSITGLKGPQGNSVKGDKGPSGSSVKGEKGVPGPTNPYVQQLSDTSTPDYQTASSRRVNPNSKNPTNHHYAISTFGNQSNVTGQLATHYQTGQLYSRGFNSTWSSWKKYLEVRNGAVDGPLNIQGSASSNEIFRINRQNADREGGELQLVHADGKQIMSIDVYDHKVAGKRKTFRFFDNIPHTKVFAEISEQGTIINGNLEVTGRIKSSGYHQEKSEFSGSVACGLAHDGNLVSVQMSPHNTHQAIMRAFDLKTGRHLQLIEPTINVGKSNVKYTSGNSLGGYYYGSLTQAEFHHSNQTEKDRSKSTVFYWSAHSMTHRIEYNMATKKYTSKNLGNTNLGPGHYWTCFATFNAGNSYDSMLFGHPDPSGDNNPDNHIRIYRQNYTGSGFKHESSRYLALSQVSGYKELVNVDNDSYAYMSFMGINPWSGRVYIWGADDAGSMMHTFQIKSSLRSSGQAWAQVLWNNCSASGSPKYGNMGGLQYIHSHKLPYVNESVHNDASTYNKVITFDPSTKLPGIITISAYGNDHGAGGTKVLGWNPAWT